jgi:hypothetical protein
MLNFREERIKMDNLTDKQKALYEKIIELPQQEKNVLGHYMQILTEGEELPDTYPYEMEIETLKIFEEFKEMYYESVRYAVQQFKR